MADLSEIRFLIERNDDGTAAHLRHDDHREHDTDGRTCWCGPTYYRVCDCDDGCWKCDHGKAEVSIEEALASLDDVFLIVHRDR